MQELFKLLLPLFWFGFTLSLPQYGNLGIYGGFNVTIKEAPYMAFYGKEDDPLYCGAAIVDEQYVLTLSVCVPQKGSDKIRVTVGTDDIDGGQRYEQEEAIFVDDDSLVVVIKLKTKLEFSDSVQKIKMADSDSKLEDGSLLLSLGFGETEAGEDSKQLMGVKLPYVEQKKCAEIYDGIVDIDDTWICAGGKEGEGVCYGDGGGPLVFNDLLFGLPALSAGDTCASEGYPVVAAKISSVKEKIDKIISGK